jgi:hypothetical protein
MFTKIMPIEESTIREQMSQAKTISKNRRYHPTYDGGRQVAQVLNAGQQLHLLTIQHCQQLNLK